MFEPHDIMCSQCASEIDQCLYEDCTEDDHHYDDPPQFCSIDCKAEYGLEDEEEDDE